MTVLAERWAEQALGGSVLALILLCAACAPPGLLEAHPGVVLVSEAQVERYEVAAKAGESLRARVQALEVALEQALRRLDRVEPRLGLDKDRGLTLKPFPGGPTRIKLPDTQRVEGRGGRAKRVSLSRLVQGRRGAVVAFWATWCVPCTSAEELRQMRLLRAQLQAQGAELISVPIDGLDKVMSDRRAASWLYPLYQRDDAHLEMLPREFVTQVGVSLPLFLVLDRSGTVTHFHGGVLSPQVIDEMVTHTAFRG